MPKEIAAPLTLEEAISYALTYNLDAEVKKLERDILKESLAGARLKMLPSLTLDGEISSRDSYDASYSDPLYESGEQDYNYSRDKTTKKFSVELSWDILNFGVAYYQQRQASEQFNIAEQRRLRVVQNLKLDVAKTFWKAVAARQATMKTRDLLERLNEREEILKRQREAQAKSEIEILEISVVISEMKMQLSGFEHEYQRHKERLSMLMGLPKTVDFELAEVDFDARLDDTGAIDVAALEMEALLHRPELYEQDMEETISLDDARIALAKTMPKPTLFYRYNYDGDSHLYEDQWHEVGLRLSFDLLTVPQQRSQKREAHIKNRLAKTRRQSVAAAVITQLRLAVIDFEDSQRKYLQSHEISDKRKELMAAQSRHFELGNSAYENMIETEAKYLTSEVRSLLSYSDLKIAEQRILNTIGSDDLGTTKFLTVKTPEPEGMVMGDTEEAALAESGDVESLEQGESLRTETMEELVAGEGLAEEPGAPDSDFEIVFSDNTLTGEPSSEENGEETDAIAMSPSPVVEASSYQGLGTPRPYSIQLASSRKKEQALTKLASFKKRGLKAYLVPITLKSSGFWWRCYEGSYETLDQANRAKDTYGIRESLVMETPYTVFLGQYESRADMKDLIMNLISLGYSPYILKSEAGEYQLVVGAFYSLEKANQWANELEGQGIRARGVLR